MGYYRQRYLDLEEEYKIARTARGLTSEEFNKYDVVIEHVGTGDNCDMYRVIYNGPGLLAQDLAIICGKGRIYYGYGATNPKIISIYKKGEDACVQA